MPIGVRISVDENDRLFARPQHQPPASLLIAFGRHRLANETSIRFGEAGDVFHPPGCVKVRTGHATMIATPQSGAILGLAKCRIRPRTVTATTAAAESASQSPNSQSR